MGSISFYNSEIVVPSRNNLLISGFFDAKPPRARDARNIIIYAGNDDNIITYEVFQALGFVNGDLNPVNQHHVIDFLGDTFAPEGFVNLSLTLGVEPFFKKLTVKFWVIKSIYLPENFVAMLGRNGIHSFCAVTSPVHGSIKFLGENNVVVTIPDVRNIGGVPPPIGSVLTFPRSDFGGFLYPLFISGEIHNVKVSQIMVDTSLECNILDKRQFDALGLSVMNLSPLPVPIHTVLGSRINGLGFIILPLKLGGRKGRKANFQFVVNSTLSFDAVLGSSFLNEFKAVVSTGHQALQFAAEDDSIITVKGNNAAAKRFGQGLLALGIYRENRLL